MTTYGTFDIDSVPAPSDYELACADEVFPVPATEFFYCQEHGIIADARVRRWDNGDPDPLHSTVQEDYCPRCKVECLPLDEYMADYLEAP